MSDAEKPDIYEVGYKKPPKSTQFVKGISGSPRGRAKRPQTFDDQLIKEFQSLITVNEDGRQVRVSKQVLMIKQTLNQAIKGDSKALILAVTFLQEALDREAERNPPDPGFIELSDGTVVTDEQLKASSFGLTTGDLRAVECMTTSQIVTYMRKRRG